MVVKSVLIAPLEAFGRGEESRGLELLGAGGDRVDSLVGRLALVADELSAGVGTPFSRAWCLGEPLATVL